MEIRSLGLGMAAGLLALCCLTDAAAAGFNQQPVFFYDTDAQGFIGRAPPGPTAIAGNTLVMIQENGSSYQVYVFVRDHGLWTETAKLSSTDRQIIPNTWGAPAVSAVALSPDGKTVFVGDPAAACPDHPSFTCGEVAVYKEPASGWVSTDTPDAWLRPSQQLFQRIGSNLAMSGDGKTLAAVASGQPCPVFPNDPLCEAIYVFQKPAGGWADGTEKAVLATGGSNDLASISVSTAGDVIATNNLIFLRPVTGWVSTLGASTSVNQTSFDSQQGDFGSLVDLSGDLYLLGSPNINTAAIYEMPAGGWASISNPPNALLMPPASVPFFLVNGMVAIGNSVFVASDNAIYEYDKPVSGWASAVPDSTVPLTDNNFFIVDSPTVLFTDGTQLFAEGYQSSLCTDFCGVGMVLSSSPTTGLSQSGLVIAGISVDDVTDSKVRITSGPGGGVVNFEFDVENIAPGVSGTAAFTATFPGKVTAANPECNIAGDTVTCPVNLSNGDGDTITVTDQLPVSAPSVHVSATLSNVTPASWDRVNATFDYTLPVFFEPLVSSDPTTFTAAPGATITGKLPVTYGGKSTLTFVVDSGPAGKFTLDAQTGAFTYKPPTMPGFTGMDSLRYYVSDGVHTSGFGEVIFDETAPSGGKSGGGGFGVLVMLSLIGAWWLRKK